MQNYNILLQDYVFVSETFQGCLDKANKKGFSFNSSSEESGGEYSCATSAFEDPVPPLERSRNLNCPKKFRCCDKINDFVSMHSSSSWCYNFTSMTATILN